MGRQWLCLVTVPVHERTLMRRRPSPQLRLSTASPLLNPLALSKPKALSHPTQGPAQVALLRAAAQNRRLVPGPVPGKRLLLQEVRRGETQSPSLAPNQQTLRLQPTCCSK